MRTQAEDVDGKPVTTTTMMQHTPSHTLSVPTWCAVKRGKPGPVGAPRIFVSSVCDVVCCIMVVVVTGFPSTS